jgi:phosphate transport system substrate-binding protein
LGLLAAAFVSLAGCGDPGQRRATPAEPATILVIAEPEIHGAVRAAAAEFSRLYPGNEIQVETARARGAMDALFRARAAMAVVGREIADEERRAAQGARVVVEAHRIARDGLVVVVHPDNPVEQIAFDDLAEIFAGTKTSWTAFGGRDRRIVPAVPSVESGATQLFVDRVLGGAPLAAPAVSAETDSAVAAFVAENADAIGFVSLPFADRGVRALRVSRLRGLPYVAADARSVYDEEYPLLRYFNVVMRVPATTLANDFLTFLSAVEGQREILQAGYVPATVPVRFTSRTPTLPSH